MIKLAVAAVFAVALTQAVQATPTTGIIQFSGGVTNASFSDAINATGSSAIQFDSTLTQVTFASGSFVGFVVPGTTIVSMLTSAWTLNSGSIASFWTAGGFTFNLTSSSFTGTTGGAGTGSATVALFGTVSGNGFTSNAFSGSFTLQDPSGGTGPYTYSGSFSLGSVPDGGTTVLLLGAALSGLALIKRKLVS